MVRAEQTDGRQPMTWSSVDWTVTEAVVRRIQDRIFRAAKIKRPRLEPDDEQSSCPVLRGLGSGNGARLPDVRPELPDAHHTWGLAAEGPRRKECFTERRPHSPGCRYPAARRSNPTCRAPETTG